MCPEKPVKQISRLLAVQVADSQPRLWERGRERDWTVRTGNTSWTWFTTGMCLGSFPPVRTCFSFIMKPDQAQTALVLTGKCTRDFVLFSSLLFYFNHTPMRKGAAVRRRNRPRESNPRPPGLDFYISTFQTFTFLVFLYVVVAKSTSRVILLWAGFFHHVSLSRTFPLVSNHIRLYYRISIKRFYPSKTWFDVIIVDF